MGAIPTSLPTLLRGLWFRRGSSAAILVLASLSCGAAALGPTYDQAARASIMRDAFASAPVFARGIEVSRQGSVGGTLDALTAATASALESGAPAGAVAVFEPAIQTIQATAVVPAEAEVVPLVWRSGLCEHVTVVSGSCQLGKGTAVVSESLAALNNWRVGTTVTANGWTAFTIVGIYRVPSAPGDYWAGKLGDFFPAEFNPNPAKNDVPLPDAMFTDRSTIEQGEGNPQGVVSVAQLVDRRVLSVGDMSRLAETSAVLSSSDALSASQATVNTQLNSTVAGVRASWRTLRVAVLLVTGQTLLLVWLLLFLSVTDAVEARGRDCALAKLRGYPRWRLLVVALSESVTLLALAWPIGVGIAWASGGALSALLLRDGTGVGVPASAWAVAGAGVIGGLVAMSIAGRRILRRPIVDQWRPTASASVQRSWVFDAVVLTIACAGLAELIGGAKVTSSAKPASLVLVVPGLVGIAIAVLASRGLVAACRAAFGLTSRHGRLAYFLAVRHVARRPAGMRTTMILTTAFALAGFGLVSWSIGHANRALVAEVTNGAPVVMTVDAPGDGRDLGAIVDQIDPAGTQAMAVDEHLAPSGGFMLVAVEPARLAAIAAWRPSFAGRSLAAIAADLKPNAAAPIPLAGGTFRVRGSVTAESEPLRLTADVAGVDGRTQHLDLGTVEGAGPVHHRRCLMTGCPCTLRDFAIGTAASHDARAAIPVTGNLTISALDVDGGCQPPFRLPLFQRPGSGLAQLHRRPGVDDARTAGLADALQVRAAGHPDRGRSPRPAAGFAGCANVTGDRPHGFAVGPRQSPRDHSRVSWPLPSSSPAHHPAACSSTAPLPSARPAATWPPPPVRSGQPPHRLITSVRGCRRPASASST